MAMANDTQKQAAQAAQAAQQPPQPPQQPPQPQQKAADAPASQDAPPRYDAGGWRERASALGVSQHAIVGATYGNDPERVYDETEISQLVQTWLAREAEGQAPVDQPADQGGGE